VRNGAHSNPAELWHWYRHPTEARVPRHQVVQALFGNLAVPPTWLTGHRAIDFWTYTPALQPPLLLGPPSAAAALALRRRATDELVGLSVAAMAVVFGVVSLLGIRGQWVLDYFTYPLRTAIIVLYGFTLWSLGRTTAEVLRRKRPAIATRVAVANPWVAAGVAVVVTALIIPALRVPHASQENASEVESIMPAVERVVPKAHPVLIEASYLVDYIDPEAIGLALERDGYTVRYPVSAVSRFGPALTVVPTGPVTRLNVCRCSPPAKSVRDAVVLARSKPPPGSVTPTPLVVSWLAR
jgi:hypothetical protein